MLHHMSYEMHKLDCKRVNSTNIPYKVLAITCSHVTSYNYYYNALLHVCYGLHSLHDGIFVLQSVVLEDEI
jgi:hypothetical protein